MTSSLIPERPLLISPTLAATIGLEESVMLHVISELLLQTPASYRQQRRWAELSQTDLTTAMPFWSLEQIKRIQRNLQAQGLIQTETIAHKADSFLYAINQDTSEIPASVSVDVEAQQHNNVQNNVVAMSIQAPQQAPYDVFNAPPSKHAKSTIPPNWQPSPTLIEDCRRSNISDDFIQQHVRTFVMYQHERQRTEFSWHNTFKKWILSKWIEEQSNQSIKELQSNMSTEWQPSGDALSILEHAGVNPAFIEDAIPEFILYWRERGIITSMWNTKFIAHIRRQWGTFTLALEHDNTPRLIPEDYQPSIPCYEVLAMANIDQEFARDQVKEFVLYWQERKDANPSWNTKFLQHVKYKWANKDKTAGPIIDKITDRSWAE